MLAPELLAGEPIQVLLGLTWLLCTALLALVQCLWSVCRGNVMHSQQYVKSANLNIIPP